MDSTITQGTWKGQLGLLLAPRELECTMALAQGLNTKEIAKVLGISPGTVTKRLYSAMFKLQVSRQTALVAEAMRRQIITPLCLSLATLIAIHSTTDDMRRDRKPAEDRIAQHETKLARKGSNKPKQHIECIA